MEERIVIFTDGACSGNPGPGGWGAVVLDRGHVRELGGGEPRTTNNRMEMMAALRALESVRGSLDRTVELYTDSTYLIQGVTEWVAGWKRRGWKRADGEPVLNRDLWEALDALDAERRAGGRVEWRYVKGHAGTPGNERCDAIGVAFAQGRSPSLYDGPVTAYEHDLARRPSSEARLSGEPRVPRAPRAPRAAGAKRTGPAVYLSLVGGRLERHRSWAECERRVKGKSGARYRKATSPDEESAILRSWGVDR